jgi:ElaB/YqjD/DUF883 family membrane-anchored ribosome-binding protein
MEHPILNQHLSELKKLLHDRAQDTGPEVAKLCAQVEATLRQLGENAKESAEQAHEKAQQALNATDRYAHEEPWQLAGLALGVGALLGYWLGRSSK